MTEVKIVLRTADQTRKAEVTLLRSKKASDVIQAAVDNWHLPADTDYSLVNTSNGKALQPSQLLSTDLIEDGNVLEVQPILVAG